MKKKSRNQTKRPTKSQAKRSIPKLKPQSPKVTSVIARMRASGISLRKASRESGIAPRTVLKRAASALRRNKSGRYTAKTKDRLVRPLLVPTPEGSLPVDVRSSRDASQLSHYWNGLHRYYETGDVSALQKFTGQFITDTGGKKFPLLTDLGILDRLGSAGVVSFESIYSWSEQ
jgi:hypothetical protein